MGCRHLGRTRQLGRYAHHFDKTRSFDRQINPEARADRGSRQATFVVGQRTFKEVESDDKGSRSFSLPPSQSSMPSRQPEPAAAQDTPAEPAPATPAGGAEESKHCEEEQPEKMKTDTQMDDMEEEREAPVPRKRGRPPTRHFPAPCSEECTPHCGGGKTYYHIKSCPHHKEQETKKFLRQLERGEQMQCRGSRRGRQQHSRSSGDKWQRGGSRQNNTPNSWNSRCFFDAAESKEVMRMNQSTSHKRNNAPDSHLREPVIPQNLVH